MKKQTHWFEKLCTMDEYEDVREQAERREAARRTTVRHRASAPFPDDEDIPPFEDEDMPTEQSDFDGAMPEKATKAAGTKRPVYDSGAPRSSASSRAKGQASSRGKTADRRTKGVKTSQPNELAYRMQPYLVLAVGALLLLCILLSACMSGFQFDLTRDTHPFRWVGYYLEYALFGLFGYGAFLLPLFMIYLAVDHIRTGRAYRPTDKGLLSLALLILIPSMIHTALLHAGAGEGVLNTWNIGALYTLGAQKLGGGVFGGLLGHLSYVALGIIGSMIVGSLVVIVLLTLLLGITPAMAWQWLCQWRQSRAARMEQSAQPAPKARASERKIASDEPAYLPEPKARKRRNEPDEQEPTDYEPLDRAVRRSTAGQSADSSETAYFDPTKALLAQSGKGEDKPLRRRASSVAARMDEEQSVSAVFEQGARAEQKDGSQVFMPDEVVVPDGVESLETVTELSPEQIRAREEAYEISHRSVARRIPRAEEVLPEEDIVTYPDHVELDMSETGEVYELEDDAEALPVTEEAAEDVTVDNSNVEMNRTEDYQGGFDYSMESLEDGEQDGTTTVTQQNGVEIQVQKLTQAERTRGDIVTEKPENEPPREYVFPRIDLLNEEKPHGASKENEIMQKMGLLRDTLTSFKVRVDEISYVCGPTVTRYEVRPAPGVRVKAVAALADDIAMNLAAQSIRIEAPIPGKSAVGIEVSNANRDTVSLRPLIDSEEFRTRKSKITSCLGQDVAGMPIFFDIAKMPHLLVAGTTNSGKSVCINSIIMSLLYKSTPQEVKFIMIDPKQVEFTVYKDIPHLMAPVVCDAKRAAAVLNLAVLEMEKRFQMIREVGMKNIAGYNAITANDRYEHPYMPYIVIVIDELAELMMQARDDVETSIVRLAQKARAAGLHLIIGTQRPSVDVITGLIKSNIPSRIAFTVASQVDSKTILDNAGAEKLLGMGDMLYAPVGSPKPLRVQGAFVSDEEVERIVEFIKKYNDPVRYDQEFLDNLDREAAMIGNKRQAVEDDGESGDAPDGMDPKFYDALRIAIDNKRISTSLLQRMLSVGYGRAAKIIDQMESMGYVGPAVGNKPREIRITEQEYAELMMNKIDG